LQRLFIVGLLVVGIVLATLGLALVVNLLSLREVAEQTQLHPAIVVVFGVRDELSHRWAQGLELALSLGGLCVVACAAWWFHRRRAH
jgi:hypothetical protein